MVGWPGMKSSWPGSRHGWLTAAGAAREQAAVAAAMEDLAGEGRIDGKTAMEDLASRGTLAYI